MENECSHHCTSSACLIHVNTDLFFLDTSDENIRNLSFLLSHAISISQEYDFVRFGSCLKQFKHPLKKEEPSIHKQLEFLPVETLIEYG